MDCLTACVQVLQEAKEPLHYAELTRRILAAGLWTTGGATPAATVNARLAVEIQRRGNESKVTRVEPGVFGLRSWTGNSPEILSTPKPAKNSKPAAEPNGLKLGRSEIRTLAKKIISSSPEGIRYGAR